MALSALILGRRRGIYLLLPLILVWFYAFISGEPASVIRAAIMGSIFISALYLGRPRSALPALALAAGVMVGLEPRVLDQVSFQLSFAAVGGIILATPYFEALAGAPGLDYTGTRVTQRGTVIGWVAGALVVSLADGA